MKKYYYLLLLTLFFTTCAYSQTTNRFEEAVRASLNETNFFTDDEFFGIGVYDSLTVDEQFEFSEVARRMFAISIAEAGYQRVIKLDTLDKNKNIDYPAAIYWVGAMKKLQGDYTGALPYFDQYVSNPPPVDNQFLELAKRDIADCKFAISRTKKIDNQYEVIHLGQEVNTRYNDFAPLMVGDELYFSSLKYLKDEKMTPPRLYAKTLVASENIGASPIKGFNRMEKTVTNLTFTENKKRAYFTICDYIGKSRKIQCKIYYQDLQEKGSWSVAKALPNHINLNGFTTTHPSISYNEEGKEVLFFTSNRPGGKGKMDIWLTEVDENDFFSKPVNFSLVNTKENDLTPFYHQPTNALYFSSDGRIGLGGYDIYAYKNREIKHGGYPLNSSFNDTHFTLDPTGDKGHFSSSREGCLRLTEHDMGCQDIFAVEFINIDLEVLTFDALSKKELIGATVQLFRFPDGKNDALILVGTDALVDGRTNTLDNQFQFDGLIRDARYQLVASKEGYISDTLNFNTRGITESITLRKELYLTPDIFEMDLTVLTFDEETRDPLARCIVQLIDLETGERFIKDNIFGNDFYYSIYSQKEYRLIANLVGYSSDTLDFSTKEFTTEASITSLIKKLYLKPGGLVELSHFLPMTLYFDNDSPGSKSRGITTNNNYEELYAAFYRKKGEFIANYTQDVSSNIYEQEANKIINFFEKELKGNYDTLGVFSETLIKYLQRGNSAVISIRGFASRLAASDYNEKLARRRVNCIMNHFATYRDGMLKEYIDNGKLQLEEISFGEDKAPKNISENPKDRRNSVYSPEASKERKVQIVEITIGEDREGE